MPRPFDEAIFDPAIFDVSKDVGISGLEEYTVGGEVIDEFSETVSPNMAGSTPRRMNGPIVVQIFGDAISLTAQVERSTRDPLKSTPNWAPAGLSIDGSPYAGIEATRYFEPTRGWWRLRVDAMDPDGSINVVFSSLKV